MKNLLKKVFNINNINIINIVKKTKFNENNLGRWKIEEDFSKTELKIDYANLDNCGPCGNEINLKILK